jgi:hypothetical protein
MAGAGIRFAVHDVSAMRVTDRGLRVVMRVPEMRRAAILEPAPRHRSRGRQSVSFAGSAARPAERQAGAADVLKSRFESGPGRCCDPSKRPGRHGHDRAGRPLRLHRSSGHGSAGASPDALPLLQTLGRCRREAAGVGAGHGRRPACWIGWPGPDGPAMTFPFAARQVLVSRRAWGTSLCIARRPIVGPMSPVIVNPALPPPAAGQPRRS